MKSRKIINKITFIFSQKELTREEVRKKVVEKFLEEEPGPGKYENYNRYEYLVEKTPEGNILLTRPANLKLGFDFRIDVEGMAFLKGTRSPSHEDIFQDLKKKHQKDEVYAEEIREALIEVYGMRDPEELLKKIKDKKIGYLPELLLKLAKWFAIEQDIRYWNGWGRRKNIVWFDLIKFFDYKFKIIKKSGTPTFIFINKDGKELSEKRATTLMNDSK